MFRTHTWWKPGDGRTIMFWEHNWGIGRLQDKYPLIYSQCKTPEATLSQALQPHRLNNSFLSLNNTEMEELHAMLQDVSATQIILSVQPDRLFWMPMPSGEFTVKSAYLTLKHGPTLDSGIHRIWMLSTPPRMKIFGWLLLMNRILTTDNLQKRGWVLAGICYMCKADSETVPHLFVHCTFAKLLYGKVMQDLKLKGCSCNQRDAIVSAQVNIETKEVLLITQFILWRERCQRLFKDKEKTVTELVGEVREQMEIKKIR